MKLMYSKKTKDYHEIEIEEKILFWKWRKKYRKVNGKIFRYKGINTYGGLGFNEYLDVKDLFDIKVE